MPNFLFQISVWQEKWYIEKSKQTNKETGSTAFWVEKNCPVDLPEMEKGD